MGLILVSMLQEPGHFNPTFKLCRALQGRGHEVRYFSVPDFEQYLAGQGFACVPMFPELFPKGYTTAQDRLGRLQARRTITTQFEQVTRRLLAGEGPRAELERLSPGLVIVDINDVLTALCARQLGIPVVTINVTLPQTKDGAVPPLRSAAPYDASLRGRARAELSWRAFLAKRRAQAALASVVGLCPPYELARRAAARFGVANSELDLDTVYMPRLRRTHELVLCPQDFDFPRPPDPERHYVESIDLDRKEPAFPFERLAADKPLIYCAMGSQRYRPRQVAQLVRCVVQALALRPHWQALIALGRNLTPEQLGALPANVIAVPTVPQLAVLKRARVMITHGGLGSVKECIVHGVPMLVFPMAVDQPGNAARVAHHGLGLHGDLSRVNVPDLLASLERLLNDGIGEHVRAMKARFERVEGATHGADVVEQVLARAASAGAGPQGTP